MSREKGPKEMFCSSCGEVIKKEAAICPSCGVRNTDSPASHRKSSDHTEAGGTIFCRSCGAEIHRQAEICPDCGVSNTGEAGTLKGSSSSRNGDVATDFLSTTEQHDPDQYSTNVSDRWMWGVVTAILSGVAWFALPLDAIGITTLVFLFVWVLMPVSMYFDRQWLRANTRWNPNSLWILGAIMFPPISTLVGIAYLIQRHQYETSDISRSGSDLEDPALAELRRRYSEGEIDEEEFEARLEHLLEAEQKEKREADREMDLERELK